MKKYLKSYLLSFTAAVLSLVPKAVLAIDNPFTAGKNLVRNVGSNAGLGTEAPQLEQIIGRIINVALSFLGIFFLGLMLYGGFRWMNAQGDDAEVKKAKDIIRNAIIGLVVIVAAFAISNFVLTSLYNVTTGT